MKTTKSEKEFDSLHVTCPYRKYPCIKDDCTHFKRYHSEYDCLKYKEEEDWTLCHAGDTIELWHSCKKTLKLPTPFTWKDWIVMIMGIGGIAAIFFL